MLSPRCGQLSTGIPVASSIGEIYLPLEGPGGTYYGQELKGANLPVQLLAPPERMECASRRPSYLRIYGSAPDRSVAKLGIRES